MFYDAKPYEDSLTWGDIFTSATDFINQMTNLAPAGVGGITDTDDLTELYEILANKYLFSHIRYQTPDPFLFAIKRELYTEFPFYIEKRDLAKEMRDILITEVQIGQRQLRNTVDTHDEPIADADSVPIDDLSTQQENIRITNNKLIAIKEKYNVQNRDYIRSLYKKCDPLFRVIIADDPIFLYETEE